MRFIFKNDQQQVVVTDNNASVPNDGRFIWYDSRHPSDEDKDFLEHHFILDKHKIEESIYTISRPQIDVDAHQKNKYFVFHAITNNEFSANPLSITAFENSMVTVHENNIAVLDQVIEQVQNGKLTFDNESITLAILDNITNSYFKYVNDIEDTVFSFEYRNVNVTKNNKLMDDVFDIRSEVIKLKRVLLPMQQMIDDVTENNVLASIPINRRLIKHIQNRLKRQNDTLAASESIIEEIKDNNESYRSNKINNVMNVLTMITSIFFPLSLLTGWYGMNFSFMPELQWKYSYFIFIAIMAIITIWLILLFKKKKWF